MPARPATEIHARLLPVAQHFWAPLSLGWAITAPPVADASLDVVSKANPTSLCGRERSGGEAQSGLGRDNITRNVHISCRNVTVDIVVDIRQGLRVLYHNATIPAFSSIANRKLHCIPPEVDCSDRADSALESAKAILVLWHLRPPLGVPDDRGEALLSRAAGPFLGDLLFKIQIDAESGSPETPTSESALTKFARSPLTTAYGAVGAHWYHPPHRLPVVVRSRENASEKDKDNPPIYPNLEELIKLDQVADLLKALDI
ncbi:hypothetical protein EDB85DRAFT_1894611 [Lactarius pseudohatsudake]|nr:hypothetical protein EDB85DRAFT_1894611 [Lactarius pseudohatsudake]